MCAAYGIYQPKHVKPMRPWLFFGRDVAEHVVTPVTLAKLVWSLNL